MSKCILVLYIIVLIYTYLNKDNRLKLKQSINELYKDISRCIKEDIINVQQISI